MELLTILILLSINFILFTYLNRYFLEIKKNRNFSEKMLVSSNILKRIYDQKYKFTTFISASSVPKKDD